MDVLSDNSQKSVDGPQSSPLTRQSESNCQAAFLECSIQAVLQSIFTCLDMQTHAPIGQQRILWTLFPYMALYAI